VQQLFVHHTAGSNFDRHPKATMRAIYWFHTVRRGWCDIGYNFVISWDGRVFEGRWARRYKPWEVHDSEDARGRAVAGAHVSGFNSGSVGVSVMGNFSRVSAPPDVRRTLAERGSVCLSSPGTATRASRSVRETASTERWTTYGATRRERWGRERPRPGCRSRDRRGGLSTERP
jgi:hypothetical protein